MHYQKLWLFLGEQSQQTHIQMLLCKEHKNNILFVYLKGLYFLPQAYLRYSRNPVCRRRCRSAFQRFSLEEIDEYRTATICKVSVVAA